MSSSSYEAPIKFLENGAITAHYAQKLFLGVRAIGTAAL